MDPAPRIALSSDPLVAALLESLGLDGNTVKSIRLVFEAGAAIVAHVELYVPDEQDQFGEAVKWQKWTATDG